MINGFKPPGNSIEETWAAESVQEQFLAVLQVKTPAEIAEDFRALADMIEASAAKKH